MEKTNGTMVFRDMWHSGGDDSGHPDILLCKKEKDGTCLPVLPVVVELPDSEPSGRLALSMRQLKLDIGLYIGKISGCIIRLPVVRMNRSAHLWRTFRKMT